MGSQLRSLSLAAAAALAATPATSLDAQRSRTAAPRSPLRAITYTCRLDARPLASPAPARRLPDSDPCHVPLFDLVLPDDIPADLLRSRLETETVLAVEIAANGSFADCRAIAPSAVPRLDRIACDSIARRGRFRPFYSAPGRPGSALWEIRVRLDVTDQPPPIFFVPAAPAAGGDVPPRPGPWPRLYWQSPFELAAVPGIQNRFPAAAAVDGMVSLDLLVSAANGIESCVVGVSSGDRALDTAACEVARTVSLLYPRPCETCWGGTVPLQVVWRRRGGSHIRYPLPMEGDSAARDRAQVRDPADTRTLTAYRFYPQPLPFLLGRSDYRGIRDRTMNSTEFRGSLDIDASGRVSVCRALGATGNPAIERRTCELIVRRARAEPRTDVFGNPVPSRGVPLRGIRLDDIR